MELQIQSNLHENNDGELMFKIEIAYWDCYSCSAFTCIIDLDYYNYPQFRMAMMDLASQNTTLETKMEVIQFIMSLVETIEVINDVINPGILSEIIDDEEVSNEFKFYIFLVDFALQSSPDQFAPLRFFDKRMNLRNFAKYVEFELN